MGNMRKVIQSRSLGKFPKTIQTRGFDSQANYAAIHQGSAEENGIQTNTQSEN